MLQITIETNNAAFDDNVPQETARVLRKLADKIENGIGSHLDRGVLIDANGASCGIWDWTITE
jgi:hypothetical protein